MRALMAERGISSRAPAKSLPADAGHLSKVSRDLKPPSRKMAERIDTALGAGGALAQVLARMESPANGRVRTRRAASARLDLSLALIAADRPDEAAYQTLTAVTSGVLVPSNHWRAAEVISAVEAARVPEAAALRDAYREWCHPAYDRMSPRNS